MEEKKKRYKVVYDRSDCIGVLTCSAFYPQRWAIGKDNKADLVGGSEDNQKLGTWVLEFDEGELERFKESAEVCPVKVIHIFDLETGEKLV